MRLLLFLAFLVVPVLEIWVLIQVGEVIGGWPTVALLLADSLLGAWLVRREGRRVWRSLQDALTSGRMPDRELADAGAVLAGGALLLTPGFVTDIAGFLAVLPFTRPAVRRLARWFFTRRMKAMAAAAQRQGAAGSPFGQVPFGGSPFGGPFAEREDNRGPVIHGQVIREQDRDEDPRPPQQRLP
ncbi:hypothetical protein Misp01_20920 [Microtetraspora sp. NBRC 13810]|uniref:FxsA family protein n=1 Tax=Microtetraspora sp. NBRC 13810 TaxID=3030990 RepID=UPI00249FAFB3|nr:FxsA family protein [Microtetraspora sp. NBRC 13810]GLW06962.1 hypothetical protein Misp01_20920 [Microtetraspora sp. NBRC 13810]